MGLSDLLGMRTAPETSVQERVSNLENKIREVSMGKADAEAAFRKERDNYNAVVSEYNVQLRDNQYLLSQRKKAEDATRELMTERDRLRDHLQDAQTSRKVAEQAATDARSQLTAFKGSMASATNTGAQVTDDEVRARMDKIFYLVQDFAVTAARGVDFG